MPHTRSFHGVAGRAYGLVRFARRVEVNGTRGQPLRPHHRVIALGPPALVLLRWLRPPPARHGVHGRADRGKKKQMPGDDSRPTREGRAREDDHDPSAGLAGAAPAGSALTLIGSHLLRGDMVPGTEIGLRVDQTLTQDATGTMVMLEVEALGLDRVRTGVSVQYVDHNLLQADERNMADHIFLRSACQRYGLWYSKPGNGVSHPLHMQRFGVPGASLAGSDSHTCAAGSLGMLAIGVGGIEVAMAMAGHPLYVTMPRVWGIRLTGALPAWVSAKDVILEMLRRHGVNGGTGRVVEYHGPGLASLTAMDRHVIANMGAELGATTTVFPADEKVRAFLRSEGRADQFTEITADPGASYDDEDEIDLSRLEPLIAKPSSPGNVVPVQEVAGEQVHQVVVGFGQPGPARL